MPPQRKTSGKKNKSASHQAKGKRKNKVKVTDVYEASDDERQLARKGHDLDEVDDYEYHVDHVNEEDDEEIDSDEAFDESDDERFESFKFQGSTKSSAKKSKKREPSVDIQEEQEINMNESDDGEPVDDDDEEEDEDGEGYVDLSAMLEDDDEQEESSKQAHKKAVDQLMQGVIDSDEDMDNMNASDSEDDGDDQHDDEGMVDFIDSLSSKKRSANDDGNAKKKRRKERTEVYEENEFNLLARDSSSADNKKKLDLGDLMGSMPNEDAFASLRKTVLELDGKGKNVVQSALTAPAAKRIQDRADRQAAYKEANKEISRWEATVKQNREAEHLSFPMQSNNTVSHRVTSATLASKFSAETSMEKQIEQALQAAGMKDEELEEFEALQLNKLSVEEVEERRKQLKIMRELMFRHEQKAKRIKKIKSKSYRKLQRKEKAKQELLAAGIGNEIDAEMTAEDQMKAALDRAEERMTLKHKNTSKWAKRALARGQTDEGTREAIMEQLRRGEELRKKIQGVQSDSDDDDDDSEGEDDDKIAKEIAGLEQELDADEQDTPKKGLFSMKFMQDADQRNLQATRAMVDDFKNEWLEEDEKDAQSSHIVQNNPGRLAFGVNKGKDGKNKTSTTVESSVELNDAGQIKKVAQSAAHNVRTSGTVNIAPVSALDQKLQEVGDDQMSPWLQQVETRVKGKKASKKNNTSKGKIEDKSELNIAKIKKAQKEETDDIQLDMSQTLPVKKKNDKKQPASQVKPKPEQADKVDKNTASKSSKVVVTSGTVGSDDDGSDDEEAIGMVHSSNKLAFAQRDLVARAFANDNVTQEFEEEKDAIMEEDADKTEDLTLPGWGDWSGKGLKKKKNKVVRKIQGVDPSKRKDAKLKNVIINEKRIKKSEKYQVTQVPFPFQTMEQYERSMRTPVGKEWNTRNTFQKLTKPRVLTKLGTVIDPLNAPFK